MKNAVLICLLIVTAKADAQVVNTRWGRFNLSTYGHCGNPRCQMCNEINAMKRRNVSNRPQTIQYTRGTTSTVSYEPAFTTSVAMNSSSSWGGAYSQSAQSSSFGGSYASSGGAYTKPAEKPDVESAGEAPTPMETVREMLATMNRFEPLTSNSVIADLGCGSDARILITAVEEYGCTGVGVEIVPSIAADAAAAVHIAECTGRIPRGSITILEEDATTWDPLPFGVTHTTAHLYGETLSKVAHVMEQARCAASPFHDVPGLKTTKVGDVYVYHNPASPLQNAVVFSLF